MKTPIQSPLQINIQKLFDGFTIKEKKVREARRRKESATRENENERTADRQTDSQTDRQTHRQTDSRETTNLQRDLAKLQENSEKTHEGNYKSTGRPCKTARN